MVLPSELHNRVDYYLKSYLSKKVVNKDGHPDNTLPTPRMSTERGFNEQQRTPVAEGILRRKSIQLRNKQQDWQVYLGPMLKLYFNLNLYALNI